MDKILFTEEFCQPENLYPFTLTRQIQDIRVGMLTIREKWEKALVLPSFDKKEDDYKDLSKARDLAEATSDGPCLLIHGNILPTPSLIAAVKVLQEGECLMSRENESLVFRISAGQIAGTHKVQVDKVTYFEETPLAIRYPWDIFQLNDKAIRLDIDMLTADRSSEPLPGNSHHSGKEKLFIEKGARISHAIFNTETGPIYIGENAEIMEGAIIRGPFAAGTSSCVKMGAKIYGATTIGPYCTAAGEIKNSVLMGYSNKAHDGYLGDSVIGEWCNLGAGTTNSNLKNTAGIVKVWTPGGLMEAGLKCGVLMGDYSRTAINTSINTGTVIGAACNVFGAGLTPRYVPSFSWGSEGVERYDFEKALTAINNWKQLKGASLQDDERVVLQYVYRHLY
jgi:UDP-N-acetylglucosamine diphosphorylase/glucosamine-1-phosphate N-acetyltransferase